MITHFKDSVLWAKALAHFDNGKFVEARRKLDQISGRRTITSEYSALLATVELGLTRETEAKSLFVKAMSGSEPTKPSYRRYIDLYCSYYLAVISGDMGERERKLQEAIQLQCPAIIRRWLPLS